MILISHRGNTAGANPERENEPEYILETLSKGFDVEIDAWYKNDEWYLGHDEPHYETDFHFLCRSGLWIHCKNYEALQKMVEIGVGINYFYHTTEDYVLTSRKYIWAYPDNVGGTNTICVLPEMIHTEADGFAGVCSDYIENYHD